MAKKRVISIAIDEQLLAALDPIMRSAHRSRSWGISQSVGLWLGSGTPVSAAGWADQSDGAIDDHAQLIMAERLGIAPETLAELAADAFAEAEAAAASSPQKGPAR